MRRFFTLLGVMSGSTQSTMSPDFRWNHPSSWFHTWDVADNPYKAGWDKTRNAQVTFSWNDPIPQIADAEVKETLPAGKVFVGTELHRNIKTFSSSIYFGMLKSSLNSPDGIPAIAKYTNNCGALIGNARCRSRHMADCSLTSEDELLKEYKLNKAVEKLNILPRVYYLSPQTSIARYITGPDLTDKVLTDSMSPEGAQEEDIQKILTYCRKKAKVRMMIQARVGEDTQNFMMRVHTAVFGADVTVRSTLFKSIIHMGVQIFELLEKLHNAGIIHGDVHMGNVAFTEPLRNVRAINWDTSKLVLLDLGLARFFPDDIKKSKTEQSSWGVNALLASPWQIASYRIGRRDDLYRAMELLCFVMMRQDKYVEFLNRPVAVPTNLNRSDAFMTKLEKTHFEKDNNGRNVALIKMYANLFQLSALSEFGFSEPHAIAIGQKLDAIVDQIRAIPTVDSRPAYSEYVAKLRDVIAFVDRISAADR